MTLRLLTYNIQRGGAGRVDAIARIISGCAPDIVVLQEATRPDVVDALAERTGMREARSYARTPNGIGRVCRAMPSSRSCPMAERFGSSASI
jgi:endonuclease/exonuclease/phosphatase family metal-dependent hydrolase